MTPGIPHRIGLLLLAVVTTQAPVRGEPLDYDVTYYRVEGDSALALRDSLDRDRPDLKPRKERGFDGYTEWRVDWNFSFERQDGSCRIGTVTTRLTVHVVLPRWEEMESAPLGLASRWSRYIEALTEHEEGHVRIAHDAERAIEQALARTPPARGCAELEATANRRGHETLKKHIDREFRYDRETDHGVTQGALFP